MDNDYLLYEVQIIGRKENTIIAYDEMNQKKVQDMEHVLWDIIYQRWKNGMSSWVYGERFILKIHLQIIWC